MKAIRTCLATNQYPPQVGGVGHSTRRIAGILAAAGIDVHVVVFIKQSQPVTQLEAVTSQREGDVTVHRVHLAFPAGGESSPDVLTQYNREMFQHLCALHETHRFDLFHGMFLYPAGFIASSVARMLELPCIVSIRGNDVGKYAFDPLRREFVRSALANADRVTTVATSLSTLADRALTPIAHKARTILNSLDVERLRPRSTPHLELRGSVVGSAGLFRYKKGLRYLFEALAELKPRFEFTLLLAGDFFKEEDRLPHLEMLERLDLAESTIVTGRVPAERMPDYLQLFDVLVFPSLFAEGCPLSMLEGMALGKAVVGSRAGAIPEVIRDRDNGLLVPPASTAALVEALGELLEEPSTRARLAERAGATVRAMTLDREAGEWTRLYEELCETRQDEAAARLRAARSAHAPPRVQP